MILPWCGRDILEWWEAEGRGEAVARYNSKYCDSKVNLTYELSAWYEPLLMIDLMMKMKLELYVKKLGKKLSMLLMTLVVWMGRVEDGRKWE